MKPRHSPIFNDYAKLAHKQGLVKIASENLKLDAYDLPHEKDMLDAAHPETAVLFESYDAFNGVIENLKEQHNMITYLVTKSPRGILTQQRYVRAQHELISETLKLGFYLESANDPKLAALADYISDELAKMAEMTNNDIAGAAAIGTAALGIAGGAFLAGAAGTAAIILVPLALAGWLIYSANNPLDAGIVNNLESAIKETEEAIHGWASGVEELAPMLEPVIADMKKLKDLVSEFNDIVDKLSAKVILLKLATKDEKINKLKDLSDEFFNSGLDEHLIELSGQIKDISENLISATPTIIKIEEGSHKRYDKHWSTWTQWLKEKTFDLIGSDTDDSIAQLKLLAETLPQFYSEMDSSLTMLKNIKSQVNAVSNVKKEQEVSKENVDAPEVNKQTPFGKYIHHV